MDDRPKEYRPRNPVPHPSRARDKIRTADVYGLVLTQDEIAVFLIMSAYEYDAEVCEDAHCQTCDTFVQMWHSIYGSLSAAHRFAVEETLSEAETPAPRHRGGGI